jgi:alkyl hydroperoxide reductase subunit D
MTVESLRDRLPDFAKDIRLNLSGVLKEDPSSGLTPRQIYGVALASAYAIKHRDLIDAVSEDAAAILSPEEITAAKSAATVMAMNNIYYRFTHLAHDAELSKLPVGLRMNVIGNPGITKVDFELYALAVSALNGCGLCIEAHTKTVEHGGISKHGIQHAVKIAAVLNATAQALEI